MPRHRPRSAVRRPWLGIILSCLCLFIVGLGLAGAPAASPASNTPLPSPVSGIATESPATVPAVPGDHATGVAGPAGEDPASGPGDGKGMKPANASPGGDVVGETPVAALPVPNGAGDILASASPEVDGVVGELASPAQAADGVGENPTMASPTADGFEAAPVSEADPTEGSTTTRGPARKSAAATADDDPETLSDPAVSSGSADPAPPAIPPEPAEEAGPNVIDTCSVPASWTLVTAPGVIASLAREVLPETGKSWTLPNTREELHFIHDVLDPDQIFIPKVKKG